MPSPNQCDEIERQGRAAGLCGQSFGQGLRARLAEYYRLMAVLDAECDKLTARRLLVWCQQPARRLQILAEIAEQCAGAYPNHSMASEGFCSWS